MENEYPKTDNYLASLLMKHEMVPNFLDEDMILIDNVQSMVSPGTIKPDMNILAVCKNGRMTADVNGLHEEISANHIFICPPETFLTNIMISADFEYLAICLTTRMLKLCLSSHINVWNQTVYIDKQRIFKMSEEEIDFFYEACALLKRCMEYERTTAWERYRPEVVKGIVSASILGFCHTLEDRCEIKSDTPKQNISLFNQFLELLQKETAKHRPVEYYASELCISTKYLTVICKKNSDKTAYDWIREYTLADITHHLRSTELSVKEISNRLGFPNTSFFGKYVKDHLGCTPMEYRLRKGKE